MQKRMFVCLGSAFLVASCKSTTKKVDPTEYGSPLPSLFEWPNSEGDIAASFPKASYGTWLLQCMDKSTSSELPAMGFPSISPGTESLAYSVRSYLHIRAESVSMFTIPRPERCGTKENPLMRSFAKSRLIMLCSIKKWNEGITCSIQVAGASAGSLEEADLLNQMKLCGFRGWGPYSFFDITDKTCDGSLKVQKADGTALMEQRRFTEIDRGRFIGQFIYDPAQNTLITVHPNGKRTEALFLGAEVSYGSLY